MTVRAASAILAVSLWAIATVAPAGAEEMTQRLGIQPIFGFVSVTGDYYLGDCHDSFFSGGQSTGVRLNMGITRWFSIAFTLQPAFWSIRRGHFIDTRRDPASIPYCDDLGSDPQGIPVTGYERIVITSLAQKASFKVHDNANLYLLLGEGIYHREIGYSWSKAGEEANITETDRYTGLALAFGMDLHVSPEISVYFELSAHLLSDSNGAGAVLLSPHGGLTYWINLGKKK